MNMYAREVRDALETIENERDEAAYIEGQIEDLRDEIDSKLRELEECKTVALHWFDTLCEAMYKDIDEASDDGDIEDRDDYINAEKMLDDIDAYIDAAKG